MSTRAGRLPRRLPGASLVLIGCLVAVVALAAGYQAIATARERARFPPPGKLVDIGGYQLHLRCAGNGSPAVILESGFGMSSNAWALIQPEVAKFTRACSYDRTGYGWSDPGPSTDPVPVLHTLLRNADISGPFVMVGHSYGSGLVRRYVYRFPDEVGGMVLASTSYPDQEVRRIAADENRGERLFLAIYDWSTRAGLTRIVPERFLPTMLRAYLGLLRKYLSEAAAESEIAFLHQARHVQSMRAESARPSLPEEMEDASACSRGFGNMPLVVLTEKWVYSPARTEREIRQAQREEQRQLRLAALSSRGRKIDVDSGHLIPLERPTVVIDAIREVVAAAREAQ